MARAKKQKVGSIGWRDLTVKNADEVRDFYSKVVGWTVVPIDMGGYSDYCMVPAGGKEPAAGICHKRGANAKIPSQWLMYIIVADLDRALKLVKKHGGEQLTEVRAAGDGLFAVIRDPGGAVCGLYESGV
jgi:uncharacterized protein